MHLSCRNTRLTTLGFRDSVNTYNHALQVDLGEALVRLRGRATDRLARVPVTQDDAAVVAIDGGLREVVAEQGVGDGLGAVGALDRELLVTREGGDGGVLGPVPVGQAERLGGGGERGVGVILGDADRLLDKNLLHSG